VIGTALTDAQTSLQTAKTDLATLSTSLASVDATVASEYNVDGTSGNSQAMATSMNSLEGQICAADVQTALATASSTADDLSIKLTGRSCADALQTPAPAATPGSLVDQAATNISDWKSVSDANLATAVQSVSQDVSSLETFLGAVASGLSTAQGDLSALQVAVANVKDGISGAATDEAAAAAALVRHVAQLHGDITALCSGTCWDAIAGTVSTSSVGSIPTLTSDLQQYFLQINHGDLQSLSSALEALKALALSEVAAIAPSSGILDQSLTGLVAASMANSLTFSAAKAQGEANALNIQQQFDTAKSSLATQLDRTSARVIADLGTSINGAQVQLDGEKTMLDTQFKQVLKLLGFLPSLKPTGLGLLNVLNLGAAKAAAAEATLQNTSTKTSASSQQNHRSQVGLRAQIVQLTEGLQQVAKHPQQIFIFEVR
jgi:hypothetical protein